jgi:hypothetical protein
MADSLIHFAGEATLVRALQDEGFDHFQRKTGLARQLAGTSLDPVGLNMVIELALADFEARVENPVVTRLMRMSKARLIQAVAPDYPDLVATLTQLGAMQLRAM